MTESSVQLLPAYLLVGGDKLKRDTALERLKKRLSEHTDLSFNLDQFSGDTAEGSTIVSAANTLPFAGEKRLVIVEELDKLKKADAEDLIAYLKSPAETTVLLGCAEKLAKNTRLYKAFESLDRKAVIDCTPQKAHDLPPQVRALAVSHGITITDEAARTLIGLIGEDTVALNNELKTLALSCTAKKNLDARDIEALVQRTADVKVWTLLDALSERDLAQSLWCYHRMPHLSLYSFVPLFTKRVRELITAQALLSRNQSSKLATVLGMPAWKLKNYTQWAKKYSPAELRSILKLCRDCEFALKTGESQAEIFFNLACACCSKKSS